MPTGGVWPRPSDGFKYFTDSAALFKVMNHANLISKVVDFGVLVKTNEELRSRIESLSNELEQQCVMLLTASIEATFQVDLKVRGMKKLKDHVSTALGRFEKRMMKTGRRVELEDILEVWKAQTGRVDILGDLKQVVMYRHWLAHGRYWTQKSGLSNLDPHEVWSRWQAVCNALPNFPFDAS